MDAMTFMLLVAHFLALGVAVMVFGWMIFLQRQNRTAELLHNSAGEISPGQTAAIRPSIWLTIYSADPQTIRALLPERNGFFIGPQINGWVIVSGSGLPTPGDDVDACYLFLTAMSRELGLVQFFHAETFSGHHAWARLDDGYVMRAYAWAGETIWNQGPKTLMEQYLGLNCLGYGEVSTPKFWATKEMALANVKKIPLLASVWSSDPKELHRADGITGDSSQL